MNSTKYLVCEFVCIFIIVPLLYFFGLRPLPMLLTLNLAFIYCLVVLMKDWEFPVKRLWRPKIDKKEIRRILLTFFIGGIPVLILSAFFLSRHSFFMMPGQRFRLWLTIMFLYPVISAYPQELIYRPFFMHRYRAIFKNPRARFLLSIILFSFMHIVFRNRVAIIFTLAGGILFTCTYIRTKSLFWTSVEHSLYGLVVFTSGMGSFFYGGTMSIGKIIGH